MVLAFTAANERRKAYRSGSLLSLSAPAGTGQAPALSNASGASSSRIDATASGGANIASLIPQYAVAGSNSWADLPSVATNSASIQWTNLPNPSTAYDVRLKAIGADGVTRYSNTLTAATTAPMAFPSSWQLQQYLPQNRAMRVITQRPEAGVNAAHLWATPDIPYDFPILVSGGAPPYYAVLQDAPPWMEDIQFLQVVGNELRSHKYYLRLYGANPTAVGQPTDGWLVRYRIYGQDFGRGASPTSYQEVSYRIKVDAAKFLHVAESGSGSGTISSPRGGFRGFYGTLQTDNTYAGRIVIMRGGTYSVLGRPTDEIAYIGNNIKPQSFIAYPGEAVNWDFTSGRISFWDNSDIFLQGIRTQGSRTTENGSAVENCRNFSFFGSGNQNRIYFDRCEARDVQPGTLGNDNAGWVWRPNSAPNRNRDWGFTQCLGDTAGPARTNGPTFVSVSNGDDVVFNQVKAVNWAGYKWAGAKDSGRNFSYLFCDLWNINTGSAGTNALALGASIGNTYDPSVAPTGFEYWYSRVDSGDAGAEAWGIHADGVTGGATLNYNYCAIRGAGTFHSLNAINVTANRSVIAGSLEEGSTGSHVTFADCLRSTNYSTAYFDGEGGLASAYLSANFGVRGAQIANQVI